MPNSLWCGTLEELRESAASIPDQMRVRAKELGLSVLEEECRSWTSTVEVLSKRLKGSGDKDRLFSRLIILLEVFMPSGSERADCVIFGGKSGIEKPVCGLVLELKEWRHCQVIKDSEFVEIGPESKKLRRHPLLQAWNYKGKLANFLGVSSQIEWDYLAILPHISDSDLEKLRQHQAIPREDALRIQGRNGLKECCRLISEKHYLEREPVKDKIDNFLKSPLVYPEGLFTFAKENIGKFREHTLFLDGGFGLTDKQQEFCEEILGAVEAGEPAHFVIDGSPGSGKTMVAMMLLAQALARKKKAALGMLGQQLSNIQKSILRKLYREGGGELVYSIHGGNYKNTKDIISLASGNLKGHFDLVIVDEAQRMRKQDIPTILQTATVTVMLLDERQRLAYWEGGTIANFGAAIDKSSLRERHLPSAMRCRGGQAYLDWAIDLLKSKKNMLPASRQEWTSRYSFRIFDDFEEMRSALRKKSENGNTVALLASFTESSGKKEGKVDGTIRIGPKLASGASLYNAQQPIIRWVMDNEPYERFWLEGESNTLTTAAAIYGAQGFEREYVGLVWGRDYIYNGEFQLGDLASCYDFKLTKTENNVRRWASNPKTTRELFFNRYWILLTRGIMGTYIYCEDPKTAAHLKSLCA